MGRFLSGWVSSCLRCSRQLTVSAVPFSGEVECPHCGAVNIFENSQKPEAMREGIGLARMDMNESREGTIRRTA